MATIDQDKLILASEVWKKACKKLGVRINAPYQQQLDGETINCLAFLPDFGGERGMVIGAMDLPDVSTDDRVRKFARKEGLFYSFVNVSAYANTKVAEVVFKEALNDWGYYGVREDCPVWFNGIRGSKALP